MNRFLLLPIFFLFSVAVAVAADDKAAFSAEQIIEKHIQAVGGQEKLASVKTRVALGTIKVVNQAQPIQFFLFSEAPNRLATWYKLENFYVNLTFDGDKFFVRPTQLLSKNILLAGLGSSGALEKKYQEMFTAGPMFSELSLYNALLKAGPDVTLKANKTKKVNERPAYLVEVKHKKFGAYKAYFDVETFMWVRTDYGKAELTDTRLILNNSGGSGLTLDFYHEYSDFREVDGLKLPFTIKHAVVPPVAPNNRFAVVEIILSEYKHNLNIDPKMFQ